MAGFQVSDTNVCVCEGEIVSEPDVRVFEKSGSKKTSVRLATRRRWTDTDSGELKEMASYLDIIGWGDIGERMSILNPGDAVTVVGELRSWMQKKDDGTKKYGVEIAVTGIGRKMLNPVDEAISFPSKQEAEQLSAAAAVGTSDW